MSNQNFQLTNYIRNVPRDTVLFHEGDTDVAIYFVLKGEVQLRRTSGSTVLTETLIEQGGFFGEMSFIENEQRKTTAITANDSILMVINKDNFNEVVSQNPQFALHIITGLCLRQRDLTDGSSTIEETAGKSAEGLPLPDAHDEASSLPENGEELSGTIAESASGKTYELSPENYNKYCFAKEVSCPICEHKFVTDMIRESKLQIKNRSAELRAFYEDIEPMFYNVWICPNCYYAMKRTDFDKITEIQKRNLANQSEQRKTKWNPDFSNKLSFDFTVTAYRIAVECCDSLGKKDIEERIAGLWLNAAWLYDDMGQPENALEARKNALLKYKNAYIFGTDRTDEQDQKIEYLVGKLLWGLGNIKEAREHFLKVVNRRGGYRLLRELTREALEELKTVQQS